MAETFDEYENNKINSSQEWPGGVAERKTFDTRLRASLDQVELLEGVFRRVTEFVRIYEESNKDMLEAAQRSRKEGRGLRSAAIANGMENDYQEVATVSGYSRAKNPEERLLLDDLKVLLDQFPQKNI